MPAAVKIIRKSSFTPIPWKNGGGMTHEAIRVPAGGDSFLWRVSVAHIDASGPFSDFAGYNRNMVLLQGPGLTLQFDGGEQCVLRKIGDSVQFDGAVATHCDLLNGPCVDLNFMASKSLQAEARVVRLSQSLSVRAEPAESALIFSIEAPLLLDSDAGDTRLEPWDLALVSHGTARLSRIESDSAVFLATISR